ncbi:MAG: MarR family transcriptional regulator [Acidobacteria bacterium]|nr:MAG: MarR family transcriptional regulator [Acidobacteriota bacterium]
MQASPPATARETRLGQQLFELFRRLTLDPEADHLRAVEELDLTLSQVRAIHMLACSDPGQLSGGRVAERLGISPAATSRALDALVNKGFVARTESPEDRRVRLFAITVAGRAAAARLTALKRAQLERFVAGLEPTQRETLSRALAELDLDGACS